MILCGHQRERNAGRSDRGALKANKDAFLEYACAFEKVKEAIKERRQREGTLPGCQGDCLVGFGVHRKSTYKELYEAKDRERKSYVAFILSQDTKPGSKMDALKQYLVQKKKEEKRHKIRKRKASSSASQPAVLSPSRPASPPTQSSHSQPVTAHGELEQNQAIRGLTNEQLAGRLTSKQLAHHCRRRTRGVEETEKLISEMLAAFTDSRETMGIPLIDQERMDVIWDTQRRHLPCIQDPPEVQLYTQTGSITKGGLTLPVYRCARGSTSLESFHNHLNRFIPGTSANLENFQAYLLEGLERWNEDRAAAAVTQETLPRLRCYSASLQHSLNDISQRLLGHSLVHDYSKPRQYTGELIGVEYLCSQQSLEFRVNFGCDPDAPDGIPDNLEDVVDEGFEEEEHDFTISPLSLVSSREAIRLSRDSPSPAQELPLDTQEDLCRGPDGTPGFDRVVELARYLVELREKPCLSDREATEIVRLWNKLPDCDKQGVSYPPRHKERLLQGRFKATHSQSTTCHGKESLKR
ncbi:hypothetical protein ROHU_018996 [Labeo rohita]|uniref:Uncharacterized protein n=1 Tax=Labeo rohita TaxID=84645 RepID=A0A498N3X9_LABRO|nr:hypothetical protein ROHU_018996 [Labeo rohita]